MKRPDWVCCICWDRRRVAIACTSSSTSEATDHTKEKPHFDREGNHREILDPELSVLEMQQRAGVERPARTDMLVSQVDLNAFNKALISWIIVSHIALTVVDVPELRLLILLLNPGIFDFLY